MGSSFFAGGAGSTVEGSPAVGAAGCSMVATPQSYISIFACSWLLDGNYCSLYVPSSDKCAMTYKENRD